jgi:hypothetical protein
MRMSALVLIASAMVSAPVQKLNASDDPSEDCFRAIELNPRYYALAARLGPLASPEEATIEQRTSTDFATKDEKVLLSEWGQERQRCAQAGASYRATYGPTGWSAFYSTHQSAILQAIADLYANRLNYGQFIALRGRINEEAHAVRMQFIEMAQQDAEARQAEADQQMIRALQIMQAFSQPQPEARQPRFYGTRCTSSLVGNQVVTNCN